MRDASFPTWIGSALAPLIASGDEAALLRGLLVLAGHWMEKGGSHMRFRDRVCMVDVAGPMPRGRQQRTPEQRAFLAAGCDLFDLVTSSPQGRAALEQSSVWGAGQPHQDGRRQAPGAETNPFASRLPRAVPELSKEDVRRIADSVAATLVEPGSKFCRSMEVLYDLSRRRP